MVGPRPRVLDPHGRRMEDTVTKTRDDQEDAFDRNERRNAAGLVSCDDPACQAKEAPTTPEEWRLAADHWRRHGYLHGCSHGG